MRVINLDETGIKLINNKKNQIYIKLEDLTDFVAGDYKIENNTLSFKSYKLPISDEEINNFSVILTYLKTEILKQNS